MNEKFAKILLAARDAAVCAAEEGFERILGQFQAGSKNR